MNSGKNLTTYCWIALQALNRDFRWRSPGRIALVVTTPEISAVRDADRVIDLGKFALIEAYIQYGTDDLGDPSFILSCHFYLFPAH